MKFEHLKICLGSASPRRALLLRQIGVAFEVRAGDVDEAVLPGEPPRQYVTRMAEEKARRVWQLNRDSRLSGLPVLAADTSVVLDDRILGKPTNREQAIGMLSTLSGRRHQVMTAVSLLVGDRQSTRLSISQVRIARLESADIERYWATGEPVDKAGAYAIQGKAAVFIESLEGSYSGVMGLPLFEVGQLLQSLDI
jgi:septum formation protein